jgi:hypothetical protein
MKNTMIRPPHSIASLLLLLVVLLSSACDKLDVPPGTPACIRKKIRAYETLEHIDKPLSISRWEVDGKTYYTIRPDCCDAFNEVWDEHCNYVCAPSGGISGQGDGNCPTWTEEGTTTVIWERD